MAYRYIAKLNKNVERKHICYNNRFGIAIAADLYTDRIPFGKLEDFFKNSLNHMGD